MPGILALVGGRDYRVSQFDRCTQARRQTGSVFKPFVYVAALEPREGRPTVTLASSIDDSPLELRTPAGLWAPQNFDKVFHGALDATGVVHMLAVATAVDGSAGYVAVERIDGALDGRRGSFLTQHNGILDRGKPSLSVTVVPDSATGELEGLTGRIVIDIVEGKHYYTFDYSLPNGG